MAIIILPDAQEDFLPLQEYMLNNWSETDWLNAENENSISSLCSIQVF
jgi:hypothetical protein